MNVIEALAIARLHAWRLSSTFKQRLLIKKINTIIEGKSVISEIFLHNFLIQDKPLIFYEQELLNFKNKIYPLNFDIMVSTFTDMSIANYQNSVFALIFRKINTISSILYRKTFSYFCWSV